MFENGSEVLRFDCHLHTVNDKEFIYDGNANHFIANYIAKLKEEDIAVGVITNHNKFDVVQYNAIKKKAKKEDIYILPGVELSVKEGATKTTWFAGVVKAYNWSTTTGLFELLLLQRRIRYVNMV